ncbi:Hypothetical protein A7982_09895 [Minicystis rosea]|nr:Hypothetical protein A7982_09895 [Minicystis rosea]
MPVTPFHGGIGLLAKGALRSRISLTAFCTAQVAIDCESGYHLLRAEWPFHRFLHTLPGATLACTAVALLGCAIGRSLGTGPGGSTSLLEWLKADIAALSSPRTVVSTIVLATLGHVVPNAIMHSDVRPLAPISDANPLHEWLSLPALHGSLVVAAVLGTVLVVRDVLKM